MDFDNVNLSPVEPKSKYAVLLIFRQGGVTYNTETKWKFLW